MAADERALHQTMPKSRARSVRLSDVAGLDDASKKPPP